MDTMVSFGGDARGGGDRRILVCARGAVSIDACASTRRSRETGVALRVGGAGTPPSSSYRGASIAANPVRHSAASTAPSSGAWPTASSARTQSFRHARCGAGRRHQRRNGCRRRRGDGAQARGQRRLVRAHELVRIAVERARVGGAVQHRVDHAARRDRAGRRWRRTAPAALPGVRCEQRARRLIARLRVLGGVRETRAEDVRELPVRRIGAHHDIGPIDGSAAVRRGRGNRRREDDRLRRRKRERVAAHERAAHVGARPQRRQRHAAADSR